MLTREIKRLQDELAGSKTEEAMPKKDPNPLALEIESLEWSVRTENVLKVNGIKTLGGLAGKRTRDLLRLKNFGRKNLGEVIEQLAKYGLKLAD